MLHKRDEEFNVEDATGRNGEKSSSTGFYWAPLFRNSLNLETKLVSTATLILLGSTVKRRFPLAQLQPFD